MTKILDLADIQGNILRVYGKQGFGAARYLFFHVARAEEGRAFVDAVRAQVTTARRWKNDPDALRARYYPKQKDNVRKRGEADYPGEIEDGGVKPDITVNIAFTFYGLRALEVPTRTLRAMPDEFIDGMAARAKMLGDDVFDASCDAIWRDSAGDKAVHVLVSLNADLSDDGTPVPELAQKTDWLLGLCAAGKGGVTLLAGHGPDNARWQDAAFILRDVGGGRKLPVGKEHFGFSDGFGDPVFEGQYPEELGAARVRGGGKIGPGAEQKWLPLATGEFLLGHADEAQEVPGAAMPITFSRNGTFMVWRKLHENVGGFDAYFDKAAQAFSAFRGGIPVQEARDTLLAKIAGRWPDGVPLMSAPTHQDWLDFKVKAAAAAPGTPAGDEIAAAFTDFKFRADPHGYKCPVGSHMRRVNTRDMLDPRFNSSQPKDWNGSVLNNRRRILRRGLPYGGKGPREDKGEQGIIFLAVCASIFRQFEFVQQQWLQYGLDFNAGNDTCPLLGNRYQTAKFVIPADPGTDETPFICDALPQLVEPRGGDYFFVPSMTALRMIAMGVVDPT